MKNRKRISILLVLAMVMTMLSGLAAPAGAAAAPPYTVFTSGFANVTVGDNRSSGTVTVTEREDASWADTIFVTVTLPEGVTFNTTPTATNYHNYAVPTSGSLNFEAAANNMLRVSLTGTANNTRSGVTFNFTTDLLSRLNVASAVTGDIRATVDVHQIIGGNVAWIEGDTRTIARVAARDVRVTAAAARLVQMGTGREAARITLQEVAAASLLNGEDIRLDILTPGVRFNSVTLAPSGLAAVVLDPDGAGPLTNFSADGRRYTIKTTAVSAVFAGKIDLTPFLNVDPTVTTGDIQIRVSSTHADTKVPTTTLTVANVGTAAVEVTGLANSDGTIYAGHEFKEIGTTVGTARFNLRGTGGSVITADRIVLLELSGARFAEVAAPETLFVVETRVGTGAWTPQALDITRLDEGKGAWFTTAAWGNATEIRIRDLNVEAASDTAAGDIKVKISGNLGATGELTIGKVAKPFTATANVVRIGYPATNQAAGNIVITEAARETIKLGTMKLALPTGFEFTREPRVRVTTGDLQIDEDSVEFTDGELTFDVTGVSSTVSTITIDQISYEVSRFALEGSVSVKISYVTPLTDWVDTKTIAEVVNARAGGVVSTVFTIGALTFVRDGVSSAIDAAPAIVDGRTMLPLRFAALAVGVSAEDIIWDAARRTVTLLHGDRVVQLRVGDRNMTINGVVVPLDVPASIQNGRTVLPISAIARALRASVVWDGTARTVTVTAQ